MGDWVRGASGTPLKVGLAGTGFAANLRAQALQQDGRAQLKFVAGHKPENTAAFCQNYGVSALDSWQQLGEQPDLDLIMVCTSNQDHAAIARAALEADKHVVVEYPLALAAEEGEALAALARQRGKLLHVEHIELLGGLHQAVRQHLPQIGRVFYARYATFQLQRPAPRRWTYHQDLFGFPLISALSRIHRFTDLLGTVASVSCQSRFWPAPEPGYFIACLCDAQLRFTNGAVVHIAYGKGEVFWQEDRTLELHGEEGILIFQGEEGQFVRGAEKLPIEVGSRRGLFVKDTQLVLDYLWEKKPLYVTLEASLYALKVADAAWQSARTGRTVEISEF